MSLSSRRYIPFTGCGNTYDANHILSDSRSHREGARPVLTSRIFLDQFFQAGTSNQRNFDEFRTLCSDICICWDHRKELEIRRGALDHKYRPENTPIMFLIDGTISLLIRQFLAFHDFF